MATENQVRDWLAADPELAALVKDLYEEGLIEGARALEAYGPDLPEPEGVIPAVTGGAPYYIDDFASAAHTEPARSWVAPLGHHIDAWRCTRCGQMFLKDQGYPPVHRCFGLPISRARRTAEEQS